MIDPTQPTTIYLFTILTIIIGIGITLTIIYVIKKLFDKKGENR